MSLNSEQAFEQDTIIRQLAKISSGSNRDLAYELARFKRERGYQALGIETWRRYLAERPELPKYDQVQRLIRVGELLIKLEESGLERPELAISILDAIRRPVLELLDNGDVQGAKDWLNKATTLGPRDLAKELEAAGYLKRVKKNIRYLITNQAELVEMTEEELLEQQGEIVVKNPVFVRGAEIFGE